MKSHSFFTKLFVGNLLLIGILLAVGGVISYRRLNEIHLAESEAHQARTVLLAERHFEGLWQRSAGRAETINRDCKQLVVDSPMRLTVIALDGAVLGDSEADPATMENHKTDDRLEIMEAMKGRPGRGIRTSETLGIEFRYLARPIRHDGRVVGVVRVAMPIVAIVRSQTFIRNALLWAALAAVAAAVLLALLLSWIWYAPLRQITQTARTLASGDLSKRASISGADELGQLGTALNEMRDNISTKIEQIAAQRENLVSVVENLREAVIALDGRGRIVLMNLSAAELLAEGGRDATGKYLQAVVRIPEILDVYNEVADAEGEQLASRQIEVEIKQRRCALDVNAARLAGGTIESLSALLVVRDVTHLVRMAAMKAEFVANASHELRTPLATIRAAVDCLPAALAGDRDELARLAEILDRHTTRLEEMTNDLLGLHLVESSRHKLRRERIDLNALATWVRDHFGQRAEQKQIALTTECSDPLDDFRSDVTLVQLILQNLLDNAVKFTPSGGAVACRLDAGGDSVTITVRDTGCGIDAEIQDRVFERFFQADSSRSGEPRIRGTGLGLAIVKHAAERLGALVKLQSRLGEGTTVTVQLPRNALA